MQRTRLNDKSGGNYFTTPKENLTFIPSGSKLLDLALGGGWCRGRASNIIGDSSTGKTLLCIEATANFARMCRARGEKFKIKYREAEDAFDDDYAEALGAPIDDIDLDKKLDTVEDFFEDIKEVAAKAKGEQILYILDSLDSLTDRAEKSRGIDEGTYGAAKAKQLSQLFRREIRNWQKANITVLIVSQIRDNIGAMFGRKFTRAGGKALQFYMSQIVILSQLGRLERTIKGVKRKTGIDIRALVDKNKVGLAFREAEFKIRFGYGIDDTEECLKFIDKSGGLKELNIGITDIKKILEFLNKLDGKPYAEAMRQIHRLVEQRWYAVEQAFLPTRSKYT